MNSSRPVAGATSGFFLALQVVLMSHSPASATCPINQIQCPSGGNMGKQAQDQLSCPSPGGTGNGGYNLVAGNLSCNVGGFTPSGASIDVQVADDYVVTVTGFPGGTPLVFKARLIVNLQACAFPTFPGDPTSAGSQASMTDGMNSDNSSLGYGGPDPTCVSKDDTLEIVLHRLTGETFMLTLDVNGSAFGGASGGTSSASAQGQLSFVGLPGGALVSSCYGYQQVVSVPVRVPLSGLEFRTPRPNPSGGEVTMDFALPRESRVDIAVLDVMGRAVRTLAGERRAAGPHAVSWDGRNHEGSAVGSGLYFVSCRVDGSEVARRRLVVTR